MAPFAAQPNIPQPNVAPFAAQPNIPQPNVAPFAAQPNIPQPNVAPFAAQPNIPPAPGKFEAQGKQEAALPSTIAPIPSWPAMESQSFQAPQPFQAVPNEPIPQPYEPQPFQAAQKGKPSEPALQPFGAGQKSQPYEPQPFQAAQKGKPSEPALQPFGAGQKPQPYEPLQPFQAAQKGKPSEPALQPFGAGQKPQPYEPLQPFQAAQKGKPSEPALQPFGAGQKSQPYEPQPFQAAQKGKPSEPALQPFGGGAQKPQPFQAAQKGKPSEPALQPFGAGQKEKPGESALNPYQPAQPQPGYQPFQPGHQPPQPSDSLFQQYNVPAVEVHAQQPYGKGKENVWKEPELPPIPQMPGTGSIPYYTAPAAPPTYPSFSGGQAPVIKSGCGCGGGLADLPYALPPESPQFAQLPAQASYMPQWSQAAPISLEPPLPQPNIPAPIQPYGQPGGEYPFMPFAGPGPLFCEPAGPFHGYPGYPSYPGYISRAEPPYGSSFPWGQPPAEGKEREGKGGGSEEKTHSEKAVISQTDAQPESKPVRSPKRKKKQSSARAAISSLIERNRRQAPRSAKPRKPVPWLGN